MLDLTIIILHYNTPDWVEKCLRSLQKFVLSNSHFQIEVVVVDNGSQIDALQNLEQLMTQFPFARILQVGKNLGFAGGNNVALRQAKSRYVMLLNSDTEATTKTNFDQLITFMDQRPEVAVITPKLLLSDGRLDWASHRGEPTPWASLTYFSGLAKLLPSVKLLSGYHQTHRNLNQIHQVDAVSGAAMLVRTEAIQRVGYLDERFFMYAEDLDWCRRFREAGYQVIYFPEVTLVHHKYKSGMGHQNAQLAQKTSHHFYDTMLQYFDKHYRHRYPTFVRSLIRLFIHIKKGTV